MANNDSKKKLNKNLEPDDLREYYAKVSEKIIKLIQEEKIAEAIKMIDIELEQPYIPHDIILNFLNTKKDLENDLKQIEYQKDIDSLSKLQLWDRIYKPKKKEIDIVYLNFWEEKFSFEIDEVDLSMMNKIFKDENIENTSKLHLILMLINLDIDHKFELYNNNLKKEYVFKPLELEKKFEVMNDISSELDNFFMKDPSKMEMALNLLQILFAYYIPEGIPYSSHMIADSIANVVYSLFDMEDIRKNEITDILTKFIMN